MEAGNIIIQPFNRDNLGTNSYDVTIGNELLIYTEGILDPRGHNRTKAIIIPEHGIILEPEVLYLASTVEQTTTFGAVPVIEGKSSLGRLGLSVHVTAGFGDDGFDGQWTLELVAKHYIKIYPYMKIAQLAYHKSSEPPLRSYGAKKDAKYQGQKGPTPSMYHKNFEP